MRVEVYPAAGDAAARAASLIAAALQGAVDERGQGTVSFSGGQAPVLKRQNLASASLPWPLAAPPRRWMKSRQALSS